MHARVAVGIAAIDLYYEMIGPQHAERRVLMIMGFTSTGTQWLQTAKQLAELGYQCCIFDNRGVGESSQPTKPLYTTKMMAQDTLQLLQHLGWNENIYVIACSMGGFIAQELILKAPANTFTGVVLTSTAFGPPLSIPPLKTLLQLVSHKKGSESSAHVRAQVTASIMVPDAWANEPVAPHLAGEGAVTNRDGIAKLLEYEAKTKPAQTRAGYRGQFNAIVWHHCPPRRLRKLGERSCFLVLAGAEDRILRPINAAIIGKHLKCQYHIYPNRGHALHLEMGPEFIKVVTDHFDACANNAKDFRSVRDSAIIPGSSSVN
ncbi:hypothetical protein SeMB42_g00068 [Synchytrium endobioticum]|uniref:Serine aminopeptidase S33 domain-containing protein n=1 Tax=Synchytrium endobioticum TaxID=286115 RepID=A0A507D3S1_9FUNG|nr:hypothetical protein SeLEV6574_g03532 [Synchytrium endobioticum]TPX54983.1 hypothetical protein SeMB42_g00071 [Synchytrium endobioticum]TPX55005.1 hypothetical protein SeMB42_g00068 [Synchytrium endobioticum]